MVEQVGRKAQVKFRDEGLPRFLPDFAQQPLWLFQIGRRLSRSLGGTTIASLQQRVDSAASLLSQLLR